MPPGEATPGRGSGRTAVAVPGALLAAALAAAPAWAQEAGDRETGRIVGRVLQDERPADPEVRVLAVAAGFADTIGEDARFRVDAAVPGIHRLILVHPNFGTDTVRATVAGGLTTGLTLRYGPGGQLSRTVHVGEPPPNPRGSGEPERPRTGRSRIVGRLIDRETSDPISSAGVGLPSVGRRTETSGDGRFVLDSIPPGTHTLRVDHVRYGERTTRVEVPSRRTIDVEMRLAPRALEVEPIEVTVDVRSTALRTAGFYERRRRAREHGYGHFLDSTELERRGNQVSHVLGTVPRLEVGQFGGSFSGASNVPYFPRYQGLSGQCLPAIYLDGAKLVGSGPARKVAAEFGPRGIDGLVNLAGVAGIEVYESPAATAAEFQGSDSRCGVIVIWTKRGGS